MPITNIDPFSDDDEFSHYTTYEAVLQPGWSPVESALFDQMEDFVGLDLLQDTTLTTAYHYAYFTKGGSPEDRYQAQEYLRQHMWTIYGVMFDEAFAYEEYQKWYDRQVA